MINVQLGAVVGNQAKSIWPGMFDPEFPNVVDGKPFQAVCNAWNSLSEIPQWDIQACRVDCAERRQMLEIGRDSVSR